MDIYTYIKLKSPLSKENRFATYAIVVIGIMALTIFQDYIYSELQNTGFYLSESLVYNTFWAFFIPLGILAFQFFNFISRRGAYIKAFYLIGSGVTFSILHILLFTSFFILISNIFFSPPHRFIAILKTAFSNQFYIAFLLYALGPFVYHKYLKRNEKKNSSQLVYADKIKVKIGASVKSIKTSTVQLIVTDKPYTIVHTNDEKFLQDKSLKDFESELDPTQFLRVHRSAIVNKRYINELVSRKNGDYDATLENGQSVRLSRHYRIKWNTLLQ